MRIKEVIKTIVFCLSVILIWCVTPPKIDSLSAILVRAILTGIVIWFYYGSFASSLSKLPRSVKAASISSARSLRQIARVILHHIELPAKRFVEWSCEIDLEAFCQQHKSPIDQANPDKNPNPAYQRTYHAYNNVTAFYFIFSYLVVLDECDFIVTLSVLFAASILIVMSRHIFSYTPVHTVIVSCALFVNSIVELIDSTPHETPIWLQPYFSVKLSFGTFSLSPLQMAIIIVGIALLLSYGSLCTRVHQLAYPDKSKA